MKIKPIKKSTHQDFKWLLDKKNNILNDYAEVVKILTKRVNDLIYICNKLHEQNIELREKIDKL